MPPPPKKKKYHGRFCAIMDTFSATLALFLLIIWGNWGTTLQSK